MRRLNPGSNAIFTGRLCKKTQGKNFKKKVITRNEGAFRQNVSFSLCQLLSLISQEHIVSSNGSRDIYLRLSSWQREICKATASG